MSVESADLTVTVLADRELAVVAPSGELDMHTGPLLHVQLANQLAHGRRHLILDLAGVPFMDSSGLNIVIRAIKETDAVGGSLKTAALTPAVQRVFDLTGITLSHPAYPDVPAAVAAVEALLSHSAPDALRPQ
jgi:stage II sporulation protein AA (anti-sigma F factor antagonist)